MKCKLKGCANQATTKPYEKGLYCSSRCALAAVRTPEHQRAAARKAALVNIARYRGKGTKTYIKEWGRHQHRVVAEKMLGRKLKKGEIVHHIDNNKHNNNPKNLLVMTQAQHAALHYRLGGKKQVRAMIKQNTKYGPLCRRKGCKLPNKIGRAYCGPHQWRFLRYGEI